MQSLIYQELNKTWKTTCKIIFNQELGELEDFDNFTSRFTQKPRHEKSKSNQDIYLAINNYYKTADFESLEKIDWSKRFEPLNINEIKDVESIVNALKDRIFYAGNIILGNSKFIEKSANITESQFAYNCKLVMQPSSYLYNVDTMIKAQYLFGCYQTGECKYLINCAVSYRSQRCLESYRV